MKTIRSFDVMPPDGKLYGFPKRFVPARQGDFYEWLLNNGYPIHKIVRDAPLEITNIAYYDNVIGPLPDGKIE